jgi:hypothetical protein
MKSLKLDVFNTEFYQTFKELTSMLVKLFYKIQSKVRLPNVFYETSIIMIPKLDEDTTKRKL